MLVQVFFQCEAVFAIQEFTDPDAVCSVLDVKLGPIPRVALGGDRQTGLTTNQLVSELGGVDTFVDTHGISIKGDDMPKVQFPVNVVQSATERSQFETGKGENWPGAKAREE